MKNIVLTGFMGTGKSTVGKELAHRLGMDFIELDVEIEKEIGTSINEIFSLYGEPYFRERETEIIKKFAKESNTVISTGGGAVMREENMKALREKGIIICLTAKPETILSRVSNSDKRPFLNTDDPLKKIKELLYIRLPFYEKADITIETDSLSPSEVADEIINKLREC